MRFLICLVVCLKLLGESLGATTLVLQASGTSWSINTATLETSASRSIGPPILVTSGTEVQPVVLIMQSSAAASWTWPDQHLTIVAEALANNGIRFQVESCRTQLLKWPLLPLDAPGTEVAWPEGEGVLFPAADTFWHQTVFAEKWQTAESLSLPAFGVRNSDHMVSWFTAQPFRTSISFPRSGRKYAASVEHEFSAKAPRLLAEDFFFLDDPTSVTAPALHYRDWLGAEGKLRTLEQKAIETSEVAKLKGAVHVYLWGSQALAESNWTSADSWKNFVRKLADESETTDTISHLLRSRFTAEEWDQVEETSASGNLYAYQKNQIAQGISRSLEDPSFRTAYPWSADIITSVAAHFAGRTDNLGTTETQLFNSYLLASAFPSTFIEPLEWGNGVSLKLLKMLKGIDRLRLCVPDHVDLKFRPWLAQYARENGWLIGTYDSYHSIHSTTSPASQTWSTAQMTQELFDNASVMKSDGTYYTGFKKTGRKLNSRAGRSFAEQRISSNFREVPYNYYFLDCDATGEFHDDYHPDHPQSGEADAEERLDKLRWITRTFGAVVGSEGGNAFAVEAIHVAEGAFNPFFGWADIAMNNPQSPYFRGRYYPPDQPGVFFKPTPLQEKYRRIYYDPAVRIPLYATALHDCIVATAHWNNDHFKWQDTQTSLALTELLYLAPPLLHLNVTDYLKRRTLFMDFYRTWSPLHKAYGFAPMTSFRYLTPDRLVQETRFGPDCRIVANFSDKAYVNADQDIPPGAAYVSAPAVWDKPRIFKPRK